MVLTPEVYSRYVEPHLADIWFEYNRALNDGDNDAARRIVIRGHFEVLKPFLFGLVRMLVRFWFRTYG